jgi:hypothetical protein
MLESFTHRVVDVAVDQVKGQDQIDIIRDFGFPVPSQVIAHMLGVAQTGSTTSSTGRATSSGSSRSRVSAGATSRGAIGRHVGPEAAGAAH